MRQKRPGVLQSMMATPMRIIPAVKMAAPISRVHHSMDSAGISTVNTPTSR